MEIKAQNMGVNTSEVFAGRGESEAGGKFYTETPDYFSNIIRNILPPSDQPYSILDMGAFRGELLSGITEKLRGEYEFQTIGVDINEEALKKNLSSQTKILSSLDKLPLEDHSVDVALMRYVLQWNNPERQKAIISELARVVKRIGIIQHVGCDNDDPKGWREKMDDLFDGKEIPKMKRGEHYFSSRDEVEQWMKEQDINFQRLQDRRINDGADVYRERYNLTEIENGEMLKILGDKNFFMQSAWIVYPKE